MTYGECNNYGQRSLVYKIISRLKALYRTWQDSHKTVVYVPCKILLDTKADSSEEEQ